MSTKAILSCAAFILLLLPSLNLGSTKSLTRYKTQVQHSQQKRDESVKKSEDKPAANISLSDPQKQAIEAVLADSKKKAAPAVLRLAQIAKQAYDNLLSDDPNEELADKLRAEMKEAAGEILAIRGDATRAAVKVLNKEQKQFLKNEMAKPGASAELIDLMVRVFKIQEK